MLNRECFGAQRPTLRHKGPRRKQAAKQRPCSISQNQHGHQACVLEWLIATQMRTGFAGYFDRFTRCCIRRIDTMQGTLQLGLPGANLLHSQSLRTGQPRARRTSCDAVRSSIVSEVLDSPATMPLRVALFTGYSDAATRGQSWLLAHVACNATSPALTCFGMHGSQVGCIGVDNRSSSVCCAGVQLQPSRRSFIAGPVRQRARCPASLTAFTTGQRSR